MRNPTLRSLDFPLTAINGIARRGKERETCIEWLKAKLE
jgi:hypothetical protein